MILQPAANVMADNSHSQTSEISYASINEAARVAAEIYNPVSIREDREFMGSILQRDGRYVFTVTAGAQGEDTVSIRIPKQLWPSVVAFWHTHGSAAPHHRFFSDVDTTLVNESGLPFYLADHTGELKIFRPGDATLSPFEAMRLGLPLQYGFALGSLVASSK